MSYSLPPPLTPLSSPFFLSLLTPLTPSHPLFIPDGEEAEEDLLPCEFCSMLVPLSAFEGHQIACGNQRGMLKPSTISAGTTSSHHHHNHTQLMSTPSPSISHHHRHRRGVVKAASMLAIRIVTADCDPLDTQPSSSEGSPPPPLSLTYNPLRQYMTPLCI